MISYDEPSDRYEFSSPPGVYVRCPVCGLHAHRLWFDGSWNFVPCDYDCKRRLFCKKSKPKSLKVFLEAVWGAPCDVPAMKKAAEEQREKAQKRWASARKSLDDFFSDLTESDGEHDVFGVK